MVQIMGYPTKLDPILWGYKSGDLNQPREVIDSHYLKLYNNFRNCEGKMKTKKIKIIKSDAISWYDLEKPGEEEYKYLQEKFKFHPLDIQDCTSPVQRPKISEYATYIFLIIRIPYYKKEGKVIAASEVDIFVGQNYLVTVHQGTSSTLKEFVKECELYEKFREKYLAFGPGFLLYEILNRMFNRCYSLLDSIGKEIDRVEEEMFQNHKRKIMETIAGIQRNVINLRKTLKAHHQVLKKIMKSDKFFLNLGGARFNNREVFFDNLVEEIDNIWDILEGHNETITALDSTHERLISHRLNQVMKTFTIVSAIFLPATLIAQCFSLSFGSEPFFKNNTLGIVFIFLSMVLTSSLMVLILRKKKWL